MVGSNIEIGKKHRDMFTVFAPFPVVFFNSHEAIKEAYVDNGGIMLVRAVRLIGVARRRRVQRPAVHTCHRGVHVRQRLRYENSRREEEELTSDQVSSTRTAAAGASSDATRSRACATSAWAATSRRPWYALRKRSRFSESRENYSCRENAGQKANDVFSVWNYCIILFDAFLPESHCLAVT